MVDLEWGRKLCAQIFVMLEGNAKQRCDKKEAAITP